MDYRVIEVLGAREYDTQYGPKTADHVKLEGHDRVFEVTRNREKPSLMVGDTVTGDIEEPAQPHWKPKIKKASNFGGGGGGGGKPQPSEKYWAAQNRAKGRASSHKVMCDVYRLGLTEGAWEPATSRSQFFERLFKIAAELDENVNAVADWPENPYA